MDKPTDEQVRELYKLCGWTYIEAHDRNERGYWEHSDGSRRHDLPPIDLEHIGFLFEYAVPKAMEKGDVGFLKWDGQRDSNKYTIFNQDRRFTDTDNPALAIFWAIYPILKEE